MKQIITLSLLLAGFTLCAQQKNNSDQSFQKSRSPKEEVSQSTPPGAADIVKNPVAADLDQEEVTASNWDNVAPAAKKLYTREQILHFSKSKLDQVNFMCTKSFRVMNENKSCPFKIEDLDMNAINQSRQPDQRAVVVIKQQDCVVKLELLTINELNAEYNKIK